MNAITIRTISARAIARVEELAALHQRTVEEEALALIEEALNSHAAREARLASADRIAAMTPKGVPPTDSTRLIREDRDQWS